jgi:bacillopeptidase F (M6 metalloprotease family)
VQCIATQIDGNYNNSQAYATTTATSPAISLVGTTNPLLTFRMWLRTEGSIYDAANLKISTDGTNFTQVMNVTPAYNVTVASEQGWGGDQSALGWQIVSADLTAYVGQTIYLRYAFRTDGSVVYPGVYIDQVLIAD